MRLSPFLLDQWLDQKLTADPPVEFDLGSSTGPVWTFRELLALEDSVDLPEQLLDTALSYTSPSGTEELRREIAGMLGTDALGAAGAAAVRAVEAAGAGRPERAPATAYEPRPRATSPSAPRTRRSGNPFIRLPKYRTRARRSESPPNAPTAIEGRSRCARRAFTARGEDFIAVFSRATSRSPARGRTSCRAFT